MVINDIFIYFRDFCYNLSEKLFNTIAGFFGYPDLSPGMPSMYLRDPEHVYRTSLPFRRLYRQGATELWQIPFGKLPETSINPRLHYANAIEGYYNIYFQDYRNLYMLPNRVSEFIQINYNICLNTNFLEGFREAAFISIMLFQGIVNLRILVSWMIVINPYTYPWIILVALIDWIDEALGGFIPSIAGVNVVGMVFNLLLGKCADALNHLIFTMPYLPGEGQKANMVVGQSSTKIKLFHYLPYLWFKYPIPNEVREFWYYKRPDILDYMMKTYSELDIQWLPESVTNDPTPTYSTIELLLKIFLKK